MEHNSVWRTASALHNIQNISVCLSKLINKSIDSYAFENEWNRNKFLGWLHIEVIVFCTNHFWLLWGHDLSCTCNKNIKRCVTLLLVSPVH